MDLQERYRKHKTFIENRWQPIDVKVLSEEDPEKKISIIREEKKRAANEIQDQDELHAFLEYLDGELKWHEAGLNQNDLSSASQTAQNNEPLNTDESTQESQNTWSRIEKINWRGTETQLVLLFNLLTSEALLKSDRKWKMIEEHFLVQGKPTKSKNLSQSLENTLAGKTKDEETLKKIVSEVKKLED